MFKKIVFLMLFAMVFLGFTQLADAQTDTFLITITVNYLSVDLLDWTEVTAYGTWAIGNVATSSVNLMTADNGGSVLEQGIYVDNASNTAIDVGCYVTNTLGWTLAGAAGADTYVLEVKDFTDWETGLNPDFAAGVTVVAATASPGTEFQNGLGATTETYIYFRLTAPSSDSSAGSQNTLTVTIEATIP